MGQQAAADLKRDGHNALFIQTHVADPASVQNMVKAVVGHYGGIDILVNNVGISHRAPIEEQTLESWDHILAINLTSVWHCVHACLPHLKASNHAAIVNITSVNADVTMPGMGAYPASKAGLVGLTRSLALDLAPHIRVNAVSPGVIRTGAWDRMDNVEAALADRLRYIPRKRIGTPEDVGKAVAFLASDDADFITGMVLTVDGGMTIQLYAR
jgi:3-oxoacyl-[acyl-carrier protein] reductase